MTFILQLYIFNILYIYIYMVHLFYVHVVVVLNLHVGDHHNVYIVRSCYICSFNV